MSEVEAILVLWRVAQQHDRGIICPAIMWDEVVRVLDGSDPLRVLRAASAECQAALRAIYQQRPWSLRSNLRDSSLRQTVEAWCLAPDAEPSGAADTAAR